MPEQQRGGDRRDQGQDQIGLTQVASLEARRPLDLADPQRRDDADQYQHGEQIDEEGKPALIAQPRQRRVLVDHPDQRDQDRRGQNQEAPEDERVDQPGTKALQQLPLSENDRRLVARSAPQLPRTVGRSGRAKQRDQEPDADREQAPARREQRHEHDRGDQRAYALAFLISSEIAGTIS
jgi:hypothetical protein